MIPESEMKKLLDELYDKRDAGTELDDYERGLFDCLGWILNGMVKPDID